MEQPSKELDLLDLVILMVSRVKLLVAGALLAGWAYLLSREYTSQAIVHLPRPLYLTDGLIMGSTRIIVQTPSEAAKIMVSPVVLDPVIAKLNLGDSVSIDRVRRQLERGIKVSVGPEHLLFLTVTASSPRQAQEWGGGILDAWLVTTQPSPREKVELEGLRAQAETSLGVMNRLIERLIADRSVRPRQAERQEEGGTSLAMALAMQPHLQQRVAVISSVMQGGVSRDVVKQAPTLPLESGAAPLGMFGLLGAILGGGLALLWVVLMDAWKRSSQSPSFSERLMRLRAGNDRK